MSIYTSLKNVDYYGCFYVKFTSKAVIHVTRFGMIEQVGLLIFVFLLRFMDSNINKSLDDEDQAKDLEFSFSPSGKFLDSKGKGFEFAVYSSQTKNQLRYEKVGNAVTDHIYQVMETNFNLKRDLLRNDDLESDQETSFVFVSNDFQDPNKKKLILINGSGAVKAGQWARSIIINDNLYSGSMLPYIDWALKNDLEVLILNTNESGPNKKGSRTPLEHAQTAWNKYFTNTVTEKSVFIVAHSFGGVVIQNIAEKNYNFDQIVAKVAFTDSVHMGSIDCTEIPIVNWISSKKDANTFLENEHGCEMRSAGTTQHAWTSHFAMNHIFDWLLTNKYQKIDDEI